MCFALSKENVGVRVRDQVKGLNLLGRGGGEEEDGKGEDQKGRMLAVYVEGIEVGVRRDKGGY